MEYIYMYTEIKMSLVWSGPVSQGSIVIYASSQVWCMLQAKAERGNLGGQIIYPILIYACASTLFIY